MASGPWQYRMVYTLHFCTFLYKFCINHISKADSQVLISETLFADLFQRSSDAVCTDNHGIIGRNVSQVKYS